MRACFLVFTSATSAATLHVIIADTTGSLLHAGFQFAYAITYAETETLSGIFVPTFLYEADALYCGSRTLVLLKEVAGKSR